MLSFFAKSGCASPNPNGILTPGNLPQTCANQNTLNTIFLVLFAIIGAIALLFFVIGAMRYTLSKGEPENIQRAKNELKYSIIGLIIVGAAAAVVKWALGRL